MHTMQWDTRPRGTRSEGASSFVPRDVHWAQEPNAADLRSRIEVLEERNKVLAKMLGQALGDLRSDGTKGIDATTTSATKQALTRVESVQICLEDSSIPLDSTVIPSHVGFGGGRVTDKEETKEAVRKDQPEDRRFSLPTRASTAETTTQASTTNSDQEATSMPPSARPSLADSEFSWMLGGNRHLSGFASSASVPPEQTRNNSKAKSGNLFGNGRDDEQRAGSESEVAMNSLRGKRGG